eukprot:scaffold5931_cov410-Prasinococcus_capsulatus_cf.AAC.6
MSGQALVTAGHLRLHRRGRAGPRPKAGRPYVGSQPTDSLGQKAFSRWGRATTFAGAASECSSTLGWRAPETAPSALK